MESKYIIPQLSAIHLLSGAEKTDNGWRVFADLSDPSAEYFVEETVQEDCPIFYQAMCLLSGNDFLAEPVCGKLRDVFAYIDFAGIFDRSPAGRVAELQQKAESMFRPEGIWLDFGRGAQRYLAFERSASMSRNNTISFLREDMYEPLRERMMLGMKIGSCQLSKLYAYNALLFTSGRRIQDTDFLTGEHIIVIDNPQTIVKDVPAITVEDDVTDAPMRRYSRVEKRMDIEVIEFDGEGFISPRLAKHIDHVEGHPHHSFQIRLPYIKGVVHEVDFAGLFAELGVSHIVDIWGKEHDTKDVEMVLTKSMFKGFGWMTENDLSFGEYLDRCRKYGHALYISGVDKLGKQETTELNYQFLNTLSITDEEFRPGDLPLGWSHSPREDDRKWITKETEAAYYDLVGAKAEESRCAYFLSDLENGEMEHTDRRRLRAELVKENPLFLNEPIFAAELSDKAENILSKYAVGQLLVAGDNRYLSDDLLRLLAIMASAGGGNNAVLNAELLTGNTMYAPMPGYAEAEQYTLLRSPHIARNEEAPVVPLKNVGYFRKKYLSHLRYVVMVDSRSLIPERLGGADYDGDMIKTIADPLLNRCVMRSSRELPLLKIPAADPLIADAEDWSARFATVKSTFSSRVGQISNTALSRGVIAYDENADDELKEQCRKDVETLAILTGLEIDSAKSGIKPDLSEYLERKTTKRSLFLKYKAILDREERRKWYEASKAARMKDFFAGVDWDAVSSNLEKLPYFAMMLGKETEKWKPEPAEDTLLFRELKTEGKLKARMEQVIADYEKALNRIRYLNHLKPNRKREQDILRILYSRGQEKKYVIDELYAAVGNVSPLEIRAMRRKLTEMQWHLTPPEERETVFSEITGSSNAYRFMELFCDFRSGGFRLLGDIICDLDDTYRQQKQLDTLAADDADSEDLRRMMRSAVRAVDYKARVVSNCLSVLQPPDAKERFDFEEAAKCALALGKRQFALEVLTYEVLKLSKERGRRK